MTEPRQTGAATAGVCPVCGTPLQVMTSAYGSTSTRCPTCSGPASQQASAAPELVRETGTTVTEEDTPDDRD